MGCTGGDIMVFGSRLVEFEPPPFVGLSQRLLNTIAILKIDNPLQN
jgi:hypothetical protein